MNTRLAHPTLRLALFASLLMAPAILEAQDQPGAATAEAVAQPTPGASQIRIVRLSQVNGQVQIVRKTGQKIEAAVANFPIVAGERLETIDGLAEVEFEDNSSVRLAPNSLVEFPVLERLPSGTTNSAVKLVHGTVYASMAPGKGLDRYTITLGNRTIGLVPSSHIRIDAASSTAATLTVFKGNVPVAGGNAQVVVGKKKSLTFDPSTAAEPTLARAGEEAPYDAWDKNSVDYHTVRVNSMLAGSTYSYGLSDLNYYGSFSDVGGCGSLWRPYLVSAAWDPYGSGLWAFNQGGYSWVSPYPWGWTPFHSGSWQYCNGSGWGWRPQAGSWNGLNNAPVRSLETATGPGHFPRPIAPHPPAPGQPSLVPVNLKAISVSRPGAEGTFAFRGDSAGLGVPRGVFSNLGKLSHQAERNQFTPTTINEGNLRHGLAWSNAPANTSAANAGGPRPLGSGQVNSFRQNGNGNAVANNRPAYDGGGRSAGFQNMSRPASAPSPSFSAPMSHASAPMSSPAPSMSAPSGGASRK